MTENTHATAECCQRPNVTERKFEKTFTPRVDIVETDGALLLYADLPGVRPDQIDLRYENGELTLTGKPVASEQAGRALFKEYDVGNYERVFQVSEAIDATAIEAEFKNGVLIVRLPKQAEAKPKQVPIKVQV